MSKQILLFVIPFLFNFDFNSKHQSIISNRANKTVYCGASVTVQNNCGAVDNVYKIKITNSSGASEEFTIPAWAQADETYLGESWRGECKIEISYFQNTLLTGAI